MSDAQKGKKRDRGAVAKIAKALKGRKRPQEVIDKIKQTKANQEHYKSRYITFNGKIQNITDWGKELGIDRRTIRSRLNKGWSIERTLTQEVRYKKKSPRSKNKPKK